MRMREIHVVGIPTNASCKQRRDGNCCKVGKGGYAHKLVSALDVYSAAVSLGPGHELSPYSPVTEEELKRHSGEFDLECIEFLDLSDRGALR